LRASSFSSRPPCCSSTHQAQAGQVNQSIKAASQPASKQQGVACASNQGSGMRHLAVLRVFLLDFLLWACRLLLLLRGRLLRGRLALQRRQRHVVLWAVRGYGPRVKGAVFVRAQPVAWGLRSSKGAGKVQDAATHAVRTVAAVRRHGQLHRLYGIGALGALPSDAAHPSLKPFDSQGFCPYALWINGSMP
jgi:hypothetical protein